MEQETQDIQNADGVVTLKLSGRISVSVKELNGYESMRADVLAPKPGVMAHFRALAAVRSIQKDGSSEPFAFPVNEADVNRVATRFTGTELDALIFKTSELYGSDEVKEAIKNG